MNYLQEYKTKNLSFEQMNNELKELIKKYNDATGEYLLVYSSNMDSGVPDCILSQKDFYFIKDLLLINDENSKKLAIYLETPGGRGETAEEIVKYVRKYYEKVNFIICGKAKSAGTILALSGDEIMMTDSGSLGPIDAQIKVGRSTVSAHDYTTWIEEKRQEAIKNNGLNPADVAILAQISPGELKGAINSQGYAIDMVKDWLAKYKFCNWETTETRGLKVTDSMRTTRAKEVAELLNNHSLWKTHGRSLKKDDLENIVNLRIHDLEKDDLRKELIYKIHAICRLMFLTSTTYKIISTAENINSFNAMPIQQQTINPMQAEMADSVEVDIKCEKCGKTHSLYLKLKDDKSIDDNMNTKGRTKFPKDNELKCDCGYVINLSGFKNEIESQLKRKTID